jgi:hypothetical protein
MSTDNEVQPVGYGTAALILIGILVGVAALMGLLKLANVGPIFPAYLFLFYWTGVRNMDKNDFLPSLFGALCGLGMAYLTATLPQVMDPTTGLAIAVGVSLFSVYLLILQKAAIIVNLGTMLFLTVGNIPALAGADFAEMALSVLIGAAFAGTLVFCGTWIAKRRATKPTVAAAV